MRRFIAAGSRSYKYTRGCTVFCPKCRIKMKEESRTFHKQRKWICPRCSKVRMQRKKPED